MEVIIEEELSTPPPTPTPAHPPALKRKLASSGPSTKLSRKAITDGLKKALDFQSVSKAKWQYTYDTKKEYLLDAFYAFDLAFAVFENRYTPLMNHYEELLTEFRPEAFERFQQGNRIRTLKMILAHIERDMLCATKETLDQDFSHPNIWMNSLKFIMENIDVGEHDDTEEWTDVVVAYQDAQREARDWAGLNEDD